MPLLLSCSPEAVAIDIGTDSTLSLRRWAVTITSSSTGALRWAVAGRARQVATTAASGGSPQVRIRDRLFMDRLPLFIIRPDTSAGPKQHPAGFTICRRGFADCRRS